MQWDRHQKKSSETKRDAEIPIPSGCEGLAWTHHHRVFWMFHETHHLYENLASPKPKEGKKFGDGEILDTFPGR